MCIEDLDRWAADVLADLTSKMAQEDSKTEDPAEIDRLLECLRMDRSTAQTGGDTSSSDDAPKKSDSLPRVLRALLDKKSKSNPIKKSEMADQRRAPSLAKTPSNPAPLVPRPRKRRGSPKVAELTDETKNPLSHSKTSWRAIRDDGKLQVYQLVLDMAGESHPFTINLDHGVVEKARRAKKTVSTHINERLSYHLSRLGAEFGHKFDFWAVLEVADSGMLHLHGAISANSNHLPELKKALKKVAGKSSSEARRWFVDVRDFDDAKHYQGLFGSEGWAAYSAKQISRTEALGLGSPVICQRDLNRRARKVWDEILEEYYAEAAAASASERTEDELSSGLGGTSVGGTTFFAFGPSLALSHLHRPAFSASGSDAAGRVRL